MATKNTKISKSRCGCRLPHESPSAGYGYASPGEVKTYHLSPEELAKYGPAKCNGRKPEHMYENQKKNKGEAEDMATRMEQAREALTREKYLTLKAEGKNDYQIMEMVALKYWPDIITKLKEEWGVSGITQEEAKKEIEGIKAVKVGVEPEDEEDGKIKEIVDEFKVQPAHEVKDEPIPESDREGMEFYKGMEKREEITAFEAMKLFDILSDQRDKITEQMDKIKAALDGVMVTI